MKKDNFVFKAEVWLWPGFSGWHFVYVPKKISDKIFLLIKSKQVKTSPNGLLPVVAKIGKTDWDTSIFPHKKEKAHLMAIKASIRKKESVKEGDLVKISFYFK